jgi:rubrerythrin
VKDVLPQPAIPVLDRIIAEEKTHLKQLTDIKKKLSETS